ncbi:TPA: hypothetical protein N0F65_012277 [Lagenidium giganteum]|uniref:AAA+ ATPase domain-containing protein n=1 Tax=Lagenidium giganteum TaxID=4803 RepID=A0AAV2ZJ23_9STRA|nr:TPA: hypothetical protein N0F65_012277 [Lagenidium giganteum]
MASAECPVCLRHFRQENLELHVDACLRRSASEESRKRKERSTPTTPVEMMSAGRTRTPPPPPPARVGTSSPEPSSAARALDMTSPAPIGVRKAAVDASKPLAERMRPQELLDVIGQDELLGPGKLLTRLIEADRVPNMILWGPPGCGKTTLASVISKKTGCKFITLSGATSNMTDMRDAVEKAKAERRMFRRHTIVFVDEIHRFKKNQQDFFLPPVEAGTITLIGATTENPSFEINNALLSRCRVYTLQALDQEAITKILNRALADPAANDLDAYVTSSSVEDAPPVTIAAADEAIEYLARQCGGDARAALNCLQMAIQTAPVDEKRVVSLSAEHVQQCFSRRQTLQYDRTADLHYDCISAFHKSIRGSDANAALYWLARMLEGGENPLFVARRMIRIASEDVGLADPSCLPLAVAAYQAAHFVGMPECDVTLAQCATMLARAPKSVEVYKAYKRVKQSIHGWDEGAMPGVPMHLRNAPTRLMKSLGFGDGYLYNPDHSPEEVKHQTYLPKELVGTNWFLPEDQIPTDQAIGPKHQSSIAPDNKRS